MIRGTASIDSRIPLRSNTKFSFDLIGSSQKFRALLEDVERVAPADFTVLIQGETATGKEVIARAIHEASPRRQNRLVALNCAAIPAALLESELFGYERGAFIPALVEHFEQKFSQIAKSTGLTEQSKVRFHRYLREWITRDMANANG